MPKSEADILNEALITFDLETQKSSSQEAAEQSDSASGSDGSESDSPLDNSAGSPAAAESTASAEQSAESSPGDSGSSAGSPGEQGTAEGAGLESSTAMGETDGYGEEQGYGEESQFPGDTGGAFPAAGTGAAGGDVIIGNIPGGTANIPGNTGGGGRQIVIIGDLPVGSGADGEEGSGGSTADGFPAGARTDAERIIILTGKLDQQLEQFDGMILSEREAVIQADNKEGSTPGGTGTGYGTGEGDGQTAPLLTAMVKGSTSNSGGGRLPPTPGDNRQGDFGSTQATAEIPADIPDGSDDDVVARQLREAAMKETDPKLREKLWDEYRKYKQGVISKK